MLARIGLVLAWTFPPTSGIAAQAAPGPWVPLGSTLDREVRWAIEDGLLPSVDPLTRPFRAAAVRDALRVIEVAELTPAGRGTVARLARALAAVGDSSSVVVEAALAAYGNGRRDSFRPGGGSGVRPAGGFRAAVVRGPVVAVLNPAFENRLKDDPEYTGYTRRFIAGRMQEAYVAAAWRHGDLFYGRLAREWGPGGGGGPFEGLLVSPVAYAVDELAGALRVGRLELTAIARRLDAFPADSAAGAGLPPFNRYFFAHRLAINAGRGVWLGVSETGVYGGPGGGFEPALHAPLNLAFLSEQNDSLEANVLFGADVSAPLGRRTRLSASLMLDDFQIDRQLPRDQTPASYGFSVVARYAMRSVAAHVSLGYTRVAALAYRNKINPEFEYSYRRVGLGRNFSDYDQLLLRLEGFVRDGWHAALDAGLTRQGAGDFRDPFPAESVLARPGQGFLVAPVRRFAGLRVTTGGELAPGIELRGEVGTTGRPAGGGGSELIGGIALHASYDALRGRFRSSWPAIQRGAHRDWP